jgi:hypothetical protein
VEGRTVTDPKLASACAWLDAWRVDGHGVTIGVDGDVTVWCALDPALESRPHDLLDQLEQDPALKLAVRAVVHAEAIIRATTNHSEAA